MPLPRCSKAGIPSAVFDLVLPFQGMPVGHEWSTCEIPKEVSRLYWYHHAVASASLKGTTMHRDRYLQYVEVLGRGEGCTVESILSEEAGLCQTRSCVRRYGGTEVDFHNSTEYTHLLIHT